MNTFFLKSGKGKYGVGGRQINASDLAIVSEEPIRLIQQLIEANNNNLPDLSILNSITPSLIADWNTKQFTASEVKKLKTLIAWRNVFITFNNFKDKTNISGVAGSNIVTLKNYNNGSVSGNYLLVNNTVSSNNINWLYLKESSKISIHYYDETNKIPDAFILEKTTELALTNYTIYKVSGATSNARFGTFTPNVDGVFSKNIYVNSL